LLNYFTGLKSRSMYETYTLTAQRQRERERGEREREPYTPCPMDGDSYECILNGR
jgi:hypothetical protein